MRIECLGHSKFLITLASGFRIVTDPFDPSTGYPVGHTRADAVLVSHHHHDHDAVETIEGYQKVIDTAGVHTLDAGIRVTALSSWHDPEGGRLRGPNLIMVLEAEGLRLVHLGDLGHMPDAGLAEKIGKPDLLLIPVGGHFTIDASAACQVCAQLKPRIILPMHYKTQYNDSWPIQPLQPFLDLCREKLGLAASEAEVLRVTGEDLECQPGLCVLKAVF